MTPTVIRTVAVLSDIHGVAPALDAVLAEPDVAAAERIVLTGDIAAGPQPVDVLDRLVDLGERVVWVRGNADRELVTLARGGTTAIPRPDRAVGGPARGAAGRPAAPRHAAARRLRRRAVLPRHPRDDEEVVLVDTRLSRWEEILAAVDPDVSTIVCGHTHMPFQRLAHRRTIMNPGNVGMPYGCPGAHWALLHEAQLRTTLLDVEAACAAIAATGCPEAEAWTDFFVRSPAGDAQALSTFAPRDGRDAEVVPR